MKHELTILTADARESNQVRNRYWIHSGARTVPVRTIVAQGLRGAPRDLFYTDGAVDALVEDAAQDGPLWAAWRQHRPRFTVAPLEAWLYLNETSLEELAARRIPELAAIDYQYHLPAEMMEAAAANGFDVVGRIRSRLYTRIREAAERRLVRVAPGRIVITEQEQARLGGVLVRGSWHALPAAERKAPEWLFNALDVESRVDAQWQL